MTTFARAGVVRLCLKRLLLWRGRVVSRKEAKAPRDRRNLVARNARPAIEWRFAPKNKSPARSATRKTTEPVALPILAELLGVFASLRETNLSLRPHHARKAGTYAL
jgi:hypothetical protein